MRTTAGMILVLCFFISGAAHAQGVHFGPQLGIYDAIDGDGSSVMGGLALRVRLSRALGIEGSVNYRREEYEGGGVVVRSWPVMVTALIYPIPIIYGAIGAGWYNSAIDYDSRYLGIFGYTTTETKQDFGWHFGGGVDLPVGGRTRLTGDIRYVFLDYGFRQFPGSGSVNSDFYVITVGLLFGL